jgi:hypothetical protein
VIARPAVISPPAEKPAGGTLSRLQLTIHSIMRGPISSVGRHPTCHRSSEAGGLYFDEPRTARWAN